MPEIRRYGRRSSIVPQRQKSQARSVLFNDPPECARNANQTVHVQTRDNAIVNRLNKTKIEKEVDHESDRQERLRLEGRKKKAEVLERVCLFLLPHPLSRPSVHGCD